MTWIDIRLQTTTPVFNAGFDAGDTTAIRVPAIRGAMRFWLRAILGSVVGDDLAALHRWESRVLGRATLPGERTSSPLQMRIPEQPAQVEAGDKPDWLPSHGSSPASQGTDKWLVYLAGRGLADARSCTLTRAHIPPGQEITVKLRPRRADPAAMSLALGALWMMSVFGGVGARTRRGFGGLRILHVDWAGHPPPTPWDKVPLTGHPVPRLGADTTLVWPRQLRVLIQVAMQRTEDTLHRWRDHPTFPVLGPQGVLPGGANPTVLALSDAIYPTWSDAMETVGHEWRLFRASDHSQLHTRGSYSPHVKTPEWTDVVWGNPPGTHFALGALGLPVVFRERIRVNLFAGEAEQRRSSPIWIRPVPSGDGWRVLTFGFRSDVLPDPVRAEPLLVNDRSRTGLTITNADLDRKLTTWCEAVTHLPATAAEPTA